MSKDTRFERRETHKYGLGVFARVPIEKGEIIASFDGSFRSASNALSLPIDQRDFDGRHAIQCGPNKWRDGKFDGIARYISHSCDPNCGIIDIRTPRDNDELLTIVALKIIIPPEELTWDYAMTEDSNFMMDCKCKSNSCRGEVGSFSMLTLGEKIKFVNRYHGLIAPWLVRKYDLY